MDRIQNEGFFNALLEIFVCHLKCKYYTQSTRENERYSPNRKLHKRRDGDIFT